MQNADCGIEIPSKDIRNCPSLSLLPSGEREGVRGKMIEGNSQMKK
jgi:hypothetical protein